MRAKGVGVYRGTEARKWREKQRRMESRIHWAGVLVGAVGIFTYLASGVVHIHGVNGGNYNDGAYVDMPGWTEKHKCGIDWKQPGMGLWCDRDY